MAFKVRVAQGKSKNQKKDEIRAKEFEQVRADNRKLKKENSRLRREIEKYYSFYVNNEVEEKTQESVSIKSQECPVCKSNNLSTVNLGIKILLVCKDCKWRKAQNV